MRTWQATTAAACCAGMLALGTVQAQPPATNTTTLSALDYIEIQQLMSRYAYAVDTGADAGNAYADLFAPGGIFGAPPGTTGHDALAAVARRFQRGPQAVFHFLMDQVVEPSADAVTGKEYLAQFIIGDEGQPSRVFGGGHYDDTYEKTPQGWRFKRRQFIASQNGPNPAIQSLPLQVPYKIAAASSKAGTLTASDYIEIQQLVSHYPFGLDTGAGEGTLYASVFTPDGVFAGGPQKVEGREKLRDFAFGHRPGQGPLYARNFSPNVVINPSPAGATGKMYAVVFDIGVGNGTPSTVLNGGHYEDVYVRTPEGWRIKSRQFLPSKSGTDAQAIEPVRVPARVTRDPGPQPKAPGKGPALAAEDYLEIQQVIATYSLALDTGASNGDVYADLFTPDGMLVAGAHKYEDREQLKAFATHDRPGQGPLFVSHYTANPLIEPSAGGATGKAYYVVLELGEGGKPSRPVGGGHYEDQYAKTSQGWRIRRRELIPSKTELPPAPPRAPRQQ